MWKEVVVVYFKVLSRHMLGETEEGQEIPQSRQPRWGLKILNQQFYTLNGNDGFRPISNTGFRLQEPVIGYVSIASLISVVIFQIYQVTISILSLCNQLHGVGSFSQVSVAHLVQKLLVLQNINDNCRLHKNSVLNANLRQFNKVHTHNNFNIIL